jgi:hypothetical protein
MSKDRPRETVAERADRNFADLLQELRVAQTGVQILFAFLLTMPLQARFEKLDDWEIATFVSCLLLTAGASVCLIAPVAYHRALFARKMKHEVVKAASRFAILGLVLLAMAITCAVDLVLDLVLGRTPALIIASALAVVLLLTWAALPLAKRYGSDPNDDLLTLPRGEAEDPAKKAGDDRRDTTGEGEPTKEH